METTKKSEGVHIIQNVDSETALIRPHEGAIESVHINGVSAYYAG